MTLVGTKTGKSERLGTGRLITERVRLTNAQVKACRATPVELVRGRAGQVIQFLGAVLELKYGGTNAFTETADNFAIKYTDGSGVAVSQTIENTGFIDQTANTTTTALPKIDAIATSAASRGQSLVLHNIGAGEIAGNAGADNTLTVSISYVVHDLR